MSDSTSLIDVNHVSWLQVLRIITNSTNERTSITSNIPQSAAGNSATIMDYDNARAVASALVLANMNSIPLDWSARLSMGGSNMNFFIVKQLPVLPPEAYLENACSDIKYVELIVPRVLELSYTANALKGFARDLGYEGDPFLWNDQRRHRLQCELDAIFAHMYHLTRSELEWILDAPPPSSCFPRLKEDEVKEFGEYRTKRYVLHAYDQLEHGNTPNLEDISGKEDKTATHSTNP